jgi:pyridoxal phosphate enzyme (YggS family)
LRRLILLFKLRDPAEFFTIRYYGRMSPASIPQNITNLRHRVRLAAEKCQRNPEVIRIMAVSKTRPAGAIRLAFENGLADFGENYLQEALPKMEQLADLELCWHFIGPIQSNKTRTIAEHFDWVHSVDRLKIARRLSEQRPAGMPPLQICLQVNISGEASKSGIDPDALAELALAVSQLPRLQLRGLMAIPARQFDPDSQRRPFARLRQAMDSLQQQLPDLDTLSMGMSGDFEAAIGEGATILRIGSAIFGPREPADGRPADGRPD